MSPPSARPFVTVVLPCLEEERHIEACLRGALGQDYPAELLEVIVADGGSRDATRAIVRAIAEEDPRVTLVDNPGRLQSAGMNEAIRRARGDVIVRMDVHAEYAKDYVRRSVEVLDRTGADNVGGAARTRSDAPFQRAVCAALDSPLGVGGSKYRNPDNEGWVESVFNGAFRRSVFERVGLYDPRAVTNEDAELNQRIHDAGGRVYLSRDVVVHYFPRDRVRPLARQYFKYGQGRARTLLKHRRLLSIRPMIPFVMVVTAAVLLAVPALHGVLAWAAGVYAGLSLVEAARVGRKGGARQVLTVWGIFPVLHVAHGVGVASGLVKYLRAPDWSAPELLAPRAPAAARAGPGAARAAGSV